MPPDKCRLLHFTDTHQPSTVRHQPNAPMTISTIKQAHCTCHCQDRGGPDLRPWSLVFSPGARRCTPMLRTVFVALDRPWTTDDGRGGGLLWHMVAHCMHPQVLGQQVTSAPSARARKDPGPGQDREPGLELPWHDMLHDMPGYATCYITYSCYITCSCYITRMSC